ncbi:hypothetical protein CL634_09530 [bacterium]|nr:hypothetical protein [bacterium]
MGFFGKKEEKLDEKTNPNNNRTFKHGDDVSDNLANNHFQFLEFFHLPSAYFVAFKAYIETFDDAYKSDWKTTQVYGRMDPIATFQRTTRSINCGFKVVASSVQEAEQNMRRISLLLQMLYPSFDTEGMPGATTTGARTASRADTRVRTIKGSPLFKVKFLNWIARGSGGDAGSAEDSGLLGYINGFTFKPNLEAGSFQVGLHLYPKYVDLSFTLSVIHEDPLGWDTGGTEGDEAGMGSGFRSTPVSPELPYGSDITTKGKRKKNKMSDEQAKRFKALKEATQSKIVGG